MKSCICLFLSLILLLSCAEEEVADFSIHELSILLNGKPWLHDSFTLDPEANRKQITGIWNIIGSDSAVDIFVGRVKNQIYEQQIYHRVPTKSGDYCLIDKQPTIVNDTIVKVSYGSLISGDVAGNTYKIVENERNYLTIESYDRDLKIISGELAVTFVNCYDEKDTLRFSNGNFRTTIEYYP